MGSVLATAATPARFGEPELLTFDNGLRVVLQPEPGAATVSLVARMGVGWNADPADAPGLAHLVEHLWFRRSVDQADVWAAAGARGCVLHATTSADTTRYEGRCGAVDAEFLVGQAIAGVVDPLAGVSVQDTALEVSIVDQELRERKDSSMELTRALYGGLQPPDHPVHALLADADFDAPALSLAQSSAWVKQNYEPRNAIITVSGGFDRGAVLSAFEAAFGAPGVAVPSAAPAEPKSMTGSGAPHSTEPIEMTGPGPLPTLMLGWNLPPQLGRSASLSIAAGHLGRRLDRELQDETVVVDSGCGLQPWDGAPALVCAIRLQPNTTLDDDLDERLDRAISGAWSPAARRALRRRLLQARAEAPQDMLLDHTRPLARARRLAEQVHDVGTVTPIESEIKAVRRWKPQGLVAVAPRWFDPARAARVRVGVDADALADSQPPWREVAPMDRVDTGVHDGDHPVRALDGVLPSLHVRTLATGLTVVGVHHAQAPYVMVSVRMPGGLGVGPAGLTEMAEALTVGSRRDEAWGVRTSHRVGRDYLEVYAVAPQGQLVRAVEAARYGVMMRAPVVDADDDGDDDLDRYVRRRRALSDAAKTTAAWRAEESLRWAVTPGHVPSTPLSNQDLRAVQRIDANALVAYLWRAYQPSGAVVYVSGPQSAEKLSKVAARQFDRWMPRQGIISGPYPTSEVAGPAVSIEAIADDASTALGWISWRCRLPAVPPAGERVVLRAALEMATFDELRHRRGWVYTPAVGISHWPDGTATIQVTVAGPPDRAGEAVAVLDALPAATLARLPAAKDRASRSLVLRLDSIEGFESLMVLMSEQGKPVADPVEAYLKQVQSVSEDGVSQTLSACRASRSFVARGPADLLRPSLEAAGFAPFTLEAP